jgi:hypothetical protein
MTVALRRIATEAPTYSADDMTRAGAKLSGGRWNSIQPQHQRHRMKRPYLPGCACKRNPLRFAHSKNRL